MAEIAAPGRPRRPAFAPLRRVAFRQDRRAAVTVVVALAAPVLVGAAGLAIDVSRWESTKLGMQTAADQASLAAGIAAQLGANATTEARAVAAQNGFVHGVAGATVVVSQPPSSGPHAGDAKAVEVVISRPGTGTISAALLATPPTITARAVSLPNAEPQGGLCLLATATSGTAISHSGNATVAANGCNIYSNSADNASSINLSGDARMTGYDIRIVGRRQLSGSAVMTATNALVQNTTATADPYAARTIPAYSGCHQNGISVGNARTFSASGSTPYVFCNGLSISGNSAVVTLNPGVYVINQGSLSISGGARLVGTGGVTVILTGPSGTNNVGSISHSGGTLQVTAPATGPTRGIALWIDGRAPSSAVSISGNGTLALTGALYAPSSVISWSGSGMVVTDTGCLQVIGRQYSISGNFSMRGNCGAVGGEHPPGSIRAAATMLKE